jgi:hypothetical protein
MGEVWLCSISHHVVTSYEGEEVTSTLDEFWCPSARLGYFSSRARYLVDRKLAAPQSRSESTVQETQKPN